MLILTIRTDKPEAEIGLYEDEKQLDYKVWLAHRQLAESLHLKIADLLKSNRKTPADLQAVAVYQGPGSFTGLRIGITVANAMADGYGLPIVGAEHDDWLKKALPRLLKGDSDKLIKPLYGASVHVTLPRT